MNKIMLMITTALCVGVFQNAKASSLSAQQIYWYAKQNNANALYYANNIDVTDKNGNTAYCLALKNKDQYAADLLA